MPRNLSDDAAASTGVLQRAFSILRILAAAKGQPMRLTDIAGRAGQSQATAHRVLQSLIQEDMVQQAGSSKTYQLSVGWFSLAAMAGAQHSTLRGLCRPAMLRLSGMLHDTLFLLVRHGFDAICLDRIDGPFPVRSHTGDIGGRVPLGLGQAGIILLAGLPEAEREEIIRFNVPRLHHLGVFDEITLRMQVRDCLQNHYVMSSGPSLYPGTTGLGVPIQDGNGQTIAALSMAAPSERISPERLPFLVEVLRKEAAAIGAQINPFDPALRRPSQFLGA
ncbi:MAG TPA: IclR family transcriptional regulator [Bordetella sp.]